MIMAPLAARDPYSAVEAAPFSTSDTGNIIRVNIRARAAIVITAFTVTLVLGHRAYSAQLQVAGIVDRNPVYHKQRLVAA